MPKRSPNFSIILAAGKGTRMRSENLHKVCFSIDGKPVINRAIETYNECGISNHIVVVGDKSGQVIETIGKEHDNIFFVYQSEQLGTADAAKMGANLLKVLDRNEEVFIVAGDKIIEPIALKKLFDTFYNNNCDMAFFVNKKQSKNDASRILSDSNNNVLGNVEIKDIWQRQVFKDIRHAVVNNQLPDKDKILKSIQKYFPDPAKAEKAFGQLWQAVAVDKRQPSKSEILNWIPENKTFFEFTNRENKSIRFSPEQAEASELTNCSVYLIKTNALNYALSKLSNDNAQKENYLSDIITILSQNKLNGNNGFTVKSVALNDHHHVMAYNDPAGLLEIEEYVRSKNKKELKLIPSDSFRTIALWEKSFNNILSGNHNKETVLWAELCNIYGKDNHEFITERSKVFLNILGHAKKIFGEEEPVMLVRSPGRVNMMGRHVDHQGGHCNLMTIGYETLVVAHPRKDDKICLYNTDSKKFPERHFSINELLSQLPWEDWLSLVNSKEVSDLVSKYGGDWSQYVKAAVLRLQKRFPANKLKGIDMLVSGEIPAASGLSSSSSLVVATAEAMIATNNLNIYPSQLVDLCGEGEWFVGTRGGSADHAAIKFGENDKIVKVTFFDFAVEDIVPFPESCVLAVCNSGIQANKTTNAKDQFNHRVACYKIGFKLIKKYAPQYAGLLKHLRDLNTANLNIYLSRIYNILLRLPMYATQEELRKLLPEENLDLIFSTHIPPKDGLYPIRGVVLYGIAECERSKIFADALKNNDIVRIGQLMNVSHDGDRVCRFTKELEKTGYMSPVSNDYILNLIDDIESGQPDRVAKAQLEWQPGGYRCSVKEIDLMIDIANNTKGVYGAQLAGAGLGGCMMVLIDKEHVHELKNNLVKNYYKPYKKEPSVMICKPIAGSKVLLKK